MAKVLLIDDEVTMVQMVTELLRREGHEVLPFSSFNPAIEALEAHKPELVITDLYLDKSRTHGLEILQKARALNPPSTVIVITAYARQQLGGGLAGVSAVLQKPLDFFALLATIQKLLAGAAAVE